MLTDEEVQARRIRDARREEKHVLAVTLIERLIGGEELYLTREERAGYRAAGERLAGAHKRLLAVIARRQRVLIGPHTTQKKEPGPLADPAPCTNDEGIVHRTGATLPVNGDRLW